jgi:hypothetical protein
MIPSACGPMCLAGSVGEINRGRGVDHYPHVRGRGSGLFEPRHPLQGEIEVAQRHAFAMAVAGLPRFLLRPGLSSSALQNFKPTERAVQYVREAPRHAPSRRISRHRCAKRRR